MPTLRRFALLLLGFCAVVHCTGRAVPTASKRGVGDLLGGGNEEKPSAQAPPPTTPQPAGHQQLPDQHLEEQPMQRPGEQHPTETETKADQAGLLGKIIEQHTTMTTSSASTSATNSATTAHTTNTAKATHAPEKTSAPEPSSTPASTPSSPTPTPTLLGEQSTHKPGVDWHVAAIASIVVTAVGLAILAALFWDTWTRLAGDVCCGRRARRAKKDTDGEELVPDWTRGSWGYSLKGPIGGGFPKFNTPPIGHNFAGTGAGSAGLGGRAAFVAAEEVVGSPPLQAPPPRMPRMRSPAMPTRDWTYNPATNVAGLGIGAPGLARSRSAATRARSDSDGRALPNPHGEDPFATPKQEDYSPGKGHKETEKDEDAYGGVL
ncbi:hypothetical protein PENSPDRAFT_685005 [Peniophora sp. CONT]|nr:hypothetical protein PENSPDRAFT_685005 [Peniophora sp. CONT]